MILHEKCSCWLHCIIIRDPLNNFDEHPVASCTTVESAEMTEVLGYAYVYATINLSIRRRAPDEPNASIAESFQVLSVHRSLTLATLARCRSRLMPKARPNERDQRQPYYVATKSLCASRLCASRTLNLMNMLRLSSQSCSDGLQRQQRPRSFLQRIVTDSALVTATRLFVVSQRLQPAAATQHVAIQQVGSMVVCRKHPHNTALKCVTPLQGVKSITATATQAPSNALFKSLLAQLVAAAQRQPAVWDALETKLDSKFEACFQVCIAVRMRGVCCYNAMDTSKAHEQALAASQCFHRPKPGAGSSHLQDICMWL